LGGREERKEPPNDPGNGVTDWIKKERVGSELKKPFGKGESHKPRGEKGTRGIM